MLDGNRQLAESLAGAFSAASESIRSFMEELGTLPGFSPAGTVTEGMSGLGGLTLGLDTGAAEKDLQAFYALAKKPVSLTANASGIVSAARTAYNSVRSIFSSPFTVRANVETSGGGEGDASGTGIKMSAGGRFARPTQIQVAEDGDAEYIIPVKKEDRAVPLLRQLLGELSPAAREQLTGGAGDLLSGGGLSAGQPVGTQITQNNSNVSAPVTIQVRSSGANPEQVGQKLYDTAERYLLRTLQDAMA